MSNHAIIQDDTPIREKVTEIEQNNLDERAKAFLRYLFKNRPYFRKWWPVMLILFLCTIIENVLSGFGAFNYILRICEGFINPAYIKPVVISLAVLIEVLKQLTGVSFFRKAFSVKFDWFVFISLLLITGLSMFSTKKGSESYVYKNIASPTLINVDSINVSYNNKIAVIDKDISFYQDRAQKQKDNWTILNKTIPSLNDQKREFEAIRESSILTALTVNDSLRIAAKSLTSETVFKVGTGVWMYNLISLLFLGILGFMLVKSARNYEVINDPNKEIKEDTIVGNDPESVTLSGDLPSLGNISPELEDVEVRQIGFKMNKNTKYSDLKHAETLETTKVSTDSDSEKVLSKEEINSRITELNRKIKSYEWKIRNRVGKETTAVKNIEEFKEQIKALKAKS